MFTANDRPRKRIHQINLSRKLHKEKYGHGTMVTLSGPNPKQAIKYQYGLYSKCILVEYDQLTYIAARSICRTMNPRKVELAYDDVFNVVSKNRNTITGIDYDFCTTLNDDLFFKITDSIGELKQNKVWIRITTSYRRMSKENLNNRKHQLKNIISSLYGYKITNETSIGYRDSSPMDVWQFELERQ